MSHEIDAALAVFADRGVRHGTLGEVARRAGISRATLYRRYPNKDALVQSVVMHEARRLFGIVDDAIAGCDDPAEMLQRGALASLRHLRDHPVLQRVLREEPEYLPLLTTRARPLITAAVDFVAPHVERAVKDERMAPVDPRIAAEWAVRMVLSLVLTPSEHDPSELLKGVPA